MREARVRVLQMVEEGTISPDEALKLLAALEGAEPAADGGAAVQGQAAVPTGASEEREREEELGPPSQSLFESPAEGKRPVAYEVKDLVKMSLGALGLGGGQRYSFNREQEGRFVGDDVSVILHNTNGRIEIWPSSDNDWHLHLAVKVRANSEAEAQREAEKLLLIDASGDKLHVQVKRVFGQNISVRMGLYLPSIRYAELRASTINGSVKVDGAVADHVKINTVNGRVEAINLQAQQLQGATTNGSLTIGGSVGHGDLKATNGSITLGVLPLTEGELNLQTVSGSISIIVADREDLGYHFDLTSTSGSIKARIPNLLVQKEFRGVGRRRLEAATPEWERQSLRHKVAARTVSGSIRVNGRE